MTVIAPVISPTTPRLYEAVCSPAGLVVRPQEGVPLLPLAQEIMANAPFVPNNRLIFNTQAWRTPLQASPQLLSELQNLAETHAMTLSLKTGTAPFAYELEPAASVAAQLEKGALTCAADVELERLFEGVPPAILEAFDETDIALLKVLPREAKFQQFVNIIATFLNDTVEDGRLDLTVEERDYCRTQAHRQLDDYIADPDSANYYPAYELFYGLQDFAGLRRLATALPDDSVDKVRLFFHLEEFDAAFRLLGGEKTNRSTQLEEFFPATRELRSVFAKQHFDAFIARRGIEKAVHFSIMWTAVDLLRLAQSYDLMIAIAKGGLWSGAVADLLGLETRVIDVHAHDLQYPTARCLDEIRPEDVAGKRVLLLDQDFVSGDSIRVTTQLVRLLKPAEIGVYLNVDLRRMRLQHKRRTRPPRDLLAGGIQFHYPEEYPRGTKRVRAQNVFYRLNEVLRTPLGRLRTTARELSAIATSLQRSDPEAAAAIMNRVTEDTKLFHRLNHMLPGTDQVRHNIVARLEWMVRTYRELSQLDPSQATERISKVARSESGLPSHAADDWAKARYEAPAIELAQHYRIENPHNPHSYTASFHAAKRAAQDQYDYVLIVGPEGFAYEPLFRDLGLPSVVVNIPEWEPGAARTLTIHDDLSVLRDKRVLVVEDDVRSGATLKKLLSALESEAPAALGLFLGSPEHRQQRENIPDVFANVYVSEPDYELDDAAFLEHLSGRENLFKT